jgi:hypothetical protein
MTVSAWTVEASTDATANNAAASVVTFKGFTDVLHLTPTAVNQTTSAAAIGLNR